MKIIDTDTLVLPETVNNDQHMKETIDTLYKAKNRDLTLQVLITNFKLLKGDVHAWQLDFDGVKGVVLFEHSGLSHKNQMKQFVGQNIYVKVIDIKESVRGVLVQANRAAAIQEISSKVYQHIEEGQIVPAVVVGVGDKKVHLEISGGVTVSMSRNQATRSKVRKSLKNFFKIGQTINVKITKIDLDKIHVSHVATLDNAWDNVKFNIGEVVVAEVIYISEKNELFAEVAPGVDALLVHDLPVPLKLGDRVQGEVKRFEADNHKLRLLVKTIL